MQFCKLGGQQPSLIPKGLAIPLDSGAGGLQVGSRAQGTRPHPAPRASAARLPSRPSCPTRAGAAAELCGAAGAAALLQGSTPPQPPTRSGAGPTLRPGSPAQGTAQRQPPEPGDGGNPPARAPSLPPRARRSRSGASPPHPPAAPFQMGRPWPAAEDGSPGPRPQSAACCAPGGRPAGLEAARGLRAPGHEQDPRGGLAAPRRPMEAARQLLLLLLLALLRLSTAAEGAWLARSRDGGAERGAAFPVRTCTLHGSGNCRRRASRGASQVGRGLLGPGRSLAGSARGGGGQSGAGKNGRTLHVLRGHGGTRGRHTTTPPLAMVAPEYACSALRAGRGGMVTSCFSPESPPSSARDWLALGVATGPCGVMSSQPHCSVE